MFGIFALMLLCFVSVVVPAAHSPLWHSALVLEHFPADLLKGCSASEVGPAPSVSVPTFKKTGIILNKKTELYTFIKYIQIHLPVCLAVRPARVEVSCLSYWRLLQLW